MANDYLAKSGDTDFYINALNQSNKKFNGLGSLATLIPGIFGATNPYAAIASVGLPILASMIPNPEEDRMKGLVADQQKMISSIQPQLRAQAAGQESAASRAIMKKVEQQANRSRQAAAASATRSGQMGTAVSRAQQQRIGSDQSAALAQLLGQQQMQSTQQYQSLINQMGGAIGTQGALAMQEQQRKAAISGSIAGLFASPDAELTELGKKNKALLEKLSKYIDSGTLQKLFDQLENMNQGGAG